MCAVRLILLISFYLNLPVCNVITHLVCVVLPSPSWCRVRGTVVGGFVWGMYRVSLLRVLELGVKIKVYDGRRLHVSRMKVEPKAVNGGKSKRGEVLID